MPLHFSPRSDPRLSFTKSIPMELYHLLPRKSFRKLAQVCLGKDSKVRTKTRTETAKTILSTGFCGVEFTTCSVFFEAAPPPSEDKGTAGVVPVKGFQIPATSASFGVYLQAEANLPKEPCGKSLQPPGREALSLTTRYDVTFKSFSRKSPPLAGRLKHCISNWEVISKDH